MEDKMEKMAQVLKKVRMTESERVHLREKLLETMRNAPVKKTPEPSPYMPAGPQWFSMSRKVYVALTCLLIVSLSGGMAFAAEGALPGDVLYPIKKDVNENVLRAINSASPVASANLETQIMQTRLTEAEELDKEQKLNDANKAIIQKNILAQEGRVEQAVV